MLVQQPPQTSDCGNADSVLARGCTEAARVPDGGEVTVPFPRLGASEASPLPPSELDHPASQLPSSELEHPNFPESSAAGSSGNDLEAQGSDMCDYDDFEVPRYELPPTRPAPHFELLPTLPHGNPEHSEQMQWFQARTIREVVIAAQCALSRGGEPDQIDKVLAHYNKMEDITCTSDKRWGDMVEDLTRISDSIGTGDYEKLDWLGRRMAENAARHGVNTCLSFEKDIVISQDIREKLCELLDAELMTPENIAVIIQLVQNLRDGKRQMQDMRIASGQWLESLKDPDVDLQLAIDEHIGYLEELVGNIDSDSSSS